MEHQPAPIRTIFDRLPCEYSELFDTAAQAGWRISSTVTGPFPYTVGSQTWEREVTTMTAWASGTPFIITAWFASDGPSGRLNQPFRITYVLIGSPWRSASMNRAKRYILRHLAPQRP